MGSFARKRKRAVRAALGMLIALCLLCSCAGPKESGRDSANDRGAEQVTGDTAPEKSSRELIEDLVRCYGAGGPDAGREVQALLSELGSLDPDAAARWGRIMTAWQTIDTELTVQYDVLPDGLLDTDELCIVALGFQLNADGTMKEELLGRLEVVKNSAGKYPQARIVCTGGGTAANAPSATEAGRMADWLIGQGIDESRILVEDRSLSTVQNALFTYALLSEQAPQVTQLAIISSDYHIAAGALLFEAEAILQAEDAGEQTMTVVANAAYPAPSGSLGSTFQARALIELSRQTDTARGAAN